MCAHEDPRGVQYMCTVDPDLEHFKLKLKQFLRTDQSYSHEKSDTPFLSFMPLECCSLCLVLFCVFKCTHLLSFFVAAKLFLAVGFVCIMCWKVRSKEMLISNIFHTKK